jgi:hypothetical protein
VVISLLLLSLFAAYGALVIVQRVRLTRKIVRMARDPHTYALHCDCGGTVELMRVNEVPVKLDGWRLQTVLIRHTPADLPADEVLQLISEMFNAQLADPRAQHSPLN